MGLLDKIFGNEKVQGFANGFLDSVFKDLGLGQAPVFGGGTAATTDVSASSAAAKKIIPAAQKKTPKFPSLNASPVGGLQTKPTQLQQTIPNQDIQGASSPADNDKPVGAAAQEKVTQQVPQLISPGSELERQLEDQALMQTYGAGSKPIQSNEGKLGQYGLGRVGNIEFKEGDTGRRMIYQDGNMIGYQEGFKTFDANGNPIQRGGLKINRNGQLALRDGKYYRVDPSMDRNDPNAYTEITEQEAMGIDRNAYNKWSSDAFNFIGFKKRGGMISKHQYGGTITEKLPRTDNWMIKDNSLNQYVSNVKPSMQIPRVGGHMLFDASVASYGNNEKPRNLAAMQQGGTINDEQTQFLQFIAQVFDIQDENQFRQVLKELGEEGLKQLQVAFKQGMNPEEVKSRLNGNKQYKKGGVMICPEGQRLVFKNGGCMCQKAENGTKVSRFGNKKQLKKKDVNPNDTINTRKYGTLRMDRVTKEQYRGMSDAEKDRHDLKAEARGEAVSGAGASPKKRFCSGGKTKARFCGGGKATPFKEGGKFNSELKDGIGKPSIIDKFVGRPKGAEYKCGGKTKKKLVKKRK